MATSAVDITATSRTFLRPKALRSVAAELFQSRGHPRRTSGRVAPPLCGIGEARVSPAPGRSRRGREPWRSGAVRTGIVALIQLLERLHFYKSMTSLVDHRIWQDVPRRHSASTSCLVNLCRWRLRWATPPPIQPSASSWAGPPTNESTASDPLPIRCPTSVDQRRLTWTCGERRSESLCLQFHGVGSQGRVPLEVIANADRRVRIPPSPQILKQRPAWKTTGRLACGGMRTFTAQR